MGHNVQMTVAQEILLAAASMAEEGREEFSEWDLTVTVWQRNKNRFGCRGYEDMYPDHKRVMMEIMGKTKDNPIRRGWIIKIGKNRYKTTPLGKAEAERLLQSSGEVQHAVRSPQLIYESILPYITHRSFVSYLRNSEEPRMWLAAAAFLGITKNDKLHLKDRLQTVENAIRMAKMWMDETQQESIRRGVTGGGITIRKIDVQRLEEFLTVLKNRFNLQIEAILNR